MQLQQLLLLLLPPLGEQSKVQQMGGQHLKLNCLIMIIKREKGGKFQTGVTEKGAERDAKYAACNIVWRHLAYTMPLCQESRFFLLSEEFSFQISMKSCHILCHLLLIRFSIKYFKYFLRKFTEKNN